MTTTLMTRLGATVALLGALACAPAAWAHAHLKTQQPAADSSVSSAPQTLTLTFTENIEPAFSGVEVLNAAQQPQTISKTVVAPENRSQMQVLLAQPLTAGSYQVNWHVLSVDGHKLKGSYGFTVQ